jgi:hypothetical protein
LLCEGSAVLAEILIWAVNGASHDSSTEMTETLVGPEDLVDLVGKRCLHARSLTTRPVIPGFGLSSRRREIIGYAGSGLGHIAFGVRDLVRRAPFAMNVPVFVVCEVSGASGLSAVALIMLASVS